MARALVALAIAVILVLTLTPSGEEKLPPLLDCLFCGDRGVADVLLNIALFFPLGAALAFAGARLGRAAVVGALLSAGVEIAQLFVPGRDTSVSDVVSNTSGAVLGWLVAVHAPRLAILEAPSARRVAAAAVALPAVVSVAVGLLLAPALPRSTYYGQWTPELGHLERYRGQVTSARLGSLALPPERLTDSDSVRTLLLGGAPLVVRATAGPRVPALASLVSVYDGEKREIFLLGPDRDDLVFRHRTRAATARLTEPDLRVSGALSGLRPGAPLAIELWRAPGGYCLVLNGKRTCGLNVSAARGWALLLYPAWLPRAVKSVVDFGWMLALFALVGFAVPRPVRPLLWSAALLVALALVPPLVGLAPTPPAGWLGGIVGLAAGAGIRALARRTRVADVAA